MDVSKQTEVEDEFYSDNEDDAEINTVTRLPAAAKIQALARVLEGFEIEMTDHLTAQVMRMGIDTKDLSALTDKDLELLGIADANQRASIIKDFAVLPNQNEHLNSDPPSRTAATNNYNTMLRNVVEHYGDLNDAISIVLAKSYGIHTEDILIDESTYSSSVVLSTVDEMSRTVARMQEKLLQVSGVSKPTATSSTLWKKLFFFGAVSAASAFVLKYTGLKTNFWNR